MKPRTYVTPLAALLAVFVFSPNAAVGQIKIQSDLAAVEAGKHHSLQLPRPNDYSDFPSLEDWIKANYTAYLVPETLIHGTQGRQETISFFTVGDDGIYDHHILYDTGDGFVLQTTADLTTSDSADEIAGTKAQPKALIAPGSSCGGDACNCVLYARCLVPSFPSPATYYTEKVKAINWPYPNWPWYGYVAVMNISPPFGHVGVVNGIGADPNWNLIVSLNEANYRPCQITYTRNGTPASMHIVGYFHP